MAPRALAKASRGLGGRSCGAPPVAAVAGGLGLDLGRAAMPCSNLAYAPRLAAAGSNPSISMIADHVGVQVHVLLAFSIPPGPSACHHMAMNHQWLAPPPFFTSGVKRLSWANSNIFTPFSEGGVRLPPFPLGQLRLPPPPPSDPLPTRRGLSRWTTPPLVHPYPPPLPKNPLMHPLHQKTESPNWTLRGYEERVVQVWGVGASQDGWVPWKVWDGPRLPRPQKNSQPLPRPHRLLLHHLLLHLPLHRLLHHLLHLHLHHLILHLPLHLCLRRHDPLRPRDAPL